MRNPAEVFAMARRLYNRSFHPDTDPAEVAELTTLTDMLKEYGRMLMERERKVG